MGCAAARAGEEEEDRAGAWPPRPWGVQHQDVERSRGTRWEGEESLESGLDLEEAAILAWPPLWLWGGAGARGVWGFSPRGGSRAREAVVVF
jgi:hypothetical protein